MQVSSITTVLPSSNSFNVIKTDEKNQDNIKEKGSKQKLTSQITKPDFYAQAFGVDSKQAKAAYIAGPILGGITGVISLSKYSRAAFLTFFRDAIKKGKYALMIPFRGVNRNSENIIETVTNQVRDNAPEMLDNLIKDKDFINIYKKYFIKRAGVVKKDILDKALNGNPEDILKVLIEAHGIGATKLSQIISGDAKVMGQIQKKYPKLAEAIKKTQSQCSASRTIQEAQEFLTKSFPDKGYVIEKELSAGSIGATYLIKKPDGTTAVLKMLKKGVDKEELEMEQILIEKLLKSLGSKDVDFKKYNKTIKEIYKDWAKELDFGIEFKNNQRLSSNANRYTVAKITDISEDASCIIMDKARGIQMNKLMEILKDYKSNPAEFNIKYAKEITENPWLKNPQKVIDELPKTIAKTFDEQFLFIKKDGNSYMHGDPHMGNFFIYADEKGNLIPEFIDTGNCIVRNGHEIKKDLRFFIDYFVGNSKGIAKYFVEQCDFAGKNKEELIEKVAKDIQENIFGRLQNITKFQEIESNINIILGKNGLEMTPEKATTMKAQLQFFTTISQIGKLSGQGFDVKTLMGDVPNAIWSMIKAGVNPYSIIKEAIKFFFKDSKQAVMTATQFIN